MMKFINRMLLPATGFLLASFVFPEMTSPTRNSFDNRAERTSESSNNFNPLEIFDFSEIFKGAGVKKIPVWEYYERYKEFEHHFEVPLIFKHAELVGVEPELLMAIRISENGKDHLAYGIKPGGKWKEVYKKNKGYYDNGNVFYLYENEKEKQLSWAAWTVRNNMERFEKNSEGHDDFISFLASVYAPIGVSNDPTGLNRNWERNVRHFYELFRGVNKNPSS